MTVYIVGDGIDPLCHLVVHGNFFIQVRVLKTLQVIQKLRKYAVECQFMDPLEFL